MLIAPFPYLALTCGHATNVECLHTTAGGGAPHPCGKCDYYGHNGVLQPGCPIDNITCSHYASVGYFYDSLDPINADSFRAPKCDSQVEAVIFQGNCPGPIGRFGIYGPFMKGFFYIKPPLVTQFWKSKCEYINKLIRN